MSCHDWFSLCRVAVETLWNILPELKVEADEELTTRVSQTAFLLIYIPPGSMRYIGQYQYNYYIMSCRLCSIMDRVRGH